MRNKQEMLDILQSHLLEFKVVHLVFWEDSPDCDFFYLYLINKGLNDNCRIDVQELRVTAIDGRIDIPDIKKIDKALGFLKKG